MKEIKRYYDVYLSYDEEQVEARNPREAIAKVRKKLKLNMLIAKTQLVYKVGDSTYIGFTLNRLKKELKREKEEREDDF